MAKRKLGTSQRISKEQLQQLGFTKIDESLFVRKIGRRISGTISLNDKGYVVNHTGMPTDKFGNVMFYRRY